jgi:hypothetical protein
MCANAKRWATVCGKLKLAINALGWIFTEFPVATINWKHNQSTQVAYGYLDFNETK